VKNRLSKKWVLGAVLVSAVVLCSLAYSHCQMPCGIYDDEARFRSIAENITTIEKGMKEIERLSAEAKPNMNQIVRWVNTKDEHANELSETVTYYFMTQRVKPPAQGDTTAYKQYVRELTLLHHMLVYAMKAKQTTDLANVQQLRSLLDEFHKIYSGTAGETRKTMVETKNTVTLKGKPLELVGNMPKVGEAVPDFEVVANDLSKATLSNFKGKTLVLCSVPSLDTPTCDTETRTFNQRATSLGPDVAVLVISMDLPFAQKRWCGAAGVENVQTLSDYRDASFGNAYGVLIKELRLLARAVFVVDKAGRIRYIQVVHELSNEPDYEAALKAVKEVRE
jgi:thioredoxin-dependent peroxiredoxin